MHSRIFLLLASSLLLVLLPYNLLRPLRANTGSPGEIVFLTLEVVANEVHLLEWTTVPGTLKQARVTSSAKGISYIASSAAGASLWRGVVDDPRIVRLEYPESDADGGIASLALVRDTATVTIRIPARTDIDRLEFFASSSGSATPLSKASAGASMGIIDWPQARQGRLR